uniref:Uncharacterized protein n=1 Tax=Setaria italica TaxID=4555 RepID=K3YCP6_SETIT
MASFATQLKDMLFVIVERVTGYGSRNDSEDQGSSSGTGDRLSVVQRNEIRPRSVDPIVSEGSKPQ